MQDYQSALSVEKDPAWRRDTQARLDMVTPKCQRSEGTGYLHFDRSPGAFLSANRRNPAEAQSDYETYLDFASREWLPARTSKPQARAAIQQLAVIGLTHHDAWLHHFIQSPTNEFSRQATDYLAKGLGRAHLVTPITL